MQLGGGNMGSNGTHEFYVFKVNNANASGKTPSGQPLPRIISPYREQSFRKMKKF
ncbi:MAG: hypothetical protein IKD29_10575 [Lentisphaeria bacterium]|nr:hypothetical protein [Lentisphaeria bacterium]